MRKTLIEAPGGATGPLPGDREECEFLLLCVRTKEGL